MANARPQAHDGNSTTFAERPFAPFETIAKSMQSQFAALAVLPHTMLKTHLSMGSEFHAFLGRRMKAQAEFCHELSQCREMADALEAQRRFSARATSEYSDEMAEMGTLLRKELSSVASVASEAVKEAGKAAKLAA